MMKTASVVLFTVLAVPACKGESKDKAPPSAAKTPAPSPAPASTPSSAPSRPSNSQLPVAIVLPAAVTDFSVSPVSFERVEASRDAAAFKQQLVDDAMGTFAGEEKLGDGWLIRYKDDTGLVLFEVQRTLGGVTWACRVGSDHQPSVDANQPLCTALSAEGATLVVPFALGEDAVDVYSSHGSVNVYRADESSSADVAAAAASAKTGLKILKEEKLPGGFAVAYQSFNGGIEAQGLIYRAITRTTIGALDVVCESGPGLKSAEDAVRAMEMCRSLRAN